MKIINTHIIMIKSETFYMDQWTKHGPLGKFVVNTSATFEKQFEQDRAYIDDNCLHMHNFGAYIC